MSQREVEYVTRLSKSALNGRGTIELRRNRNGEIFFATRYKGQYTTWHLYFKGEDWLRLHGYREGDCIDLSVAMYLHQQGLSYTGASKRRSTTSYARR
jgi:hypothetical protein